MKHLLRFSLLAVSLLAIVNCSDVNFSDEASSGSNGGLGSPDGGTVKHGDDSVGGGISQGQVPGGAGTGGTAAGGSGGTTVPGTVTGGTSTTATGTGSTAAAILPKVQFIGPPCQRLSNCEIEFRLDKPYAQQTEFNWRTDDQGKICAQSPALPPEVCAVANYHYVPNYGRVVFPAGVTSVKVFVKNINPENVAIRIDVLMTQCQYGPLFEGCSKFFY